VLDLSRIEAGALRTSSEPVELGQLIAEALALVQSQAAGRGITLRPPPPVPAGAWVRADRVRLKQVLANLLSNAVKYNRDGGHVEVTVSAPVQGRRDFAVRDSGRGLLPEQVQQLYQPFTRFVREGEVIEGTGIGLVITRRLVELMGGRLLVESEPGMGSVFRVELPVAEPRADAAPHAVAVATPAAWAAPARLLCVEDNPSNVELLRRVVALRPAWALDVARDGQSGLARLRQGGIDIALVDIDLPVLDGIELCRQAKADAATAHVPLLALSANALPGDIRRALAAGFQAYLPKPIDVGDLVARLDGLLAGRARPAEGGTA